jgi:S-(hydroxymethyl)glutathione dehydrogenase/alcohol dehydrogenase
VVRKAKVEPGASVAVIGCGAVGLNAVQGARLAGAERILAVDVSATRREGAKRFGATDVLDAAAPDAAEQVRSLTAGRGADYVIECAGHERAFRLSVEAARPGGRVVWLGKINVNAEVSFRWGTLMGEKRIVRSSYGDAVPARDFPWIAREYMAGRLLLDELITRRIALEEINDGFAALARGEGIRTVAMIR